jgi:hypothetical protein
MKAVVEAPTSSVDCSVMIKLSYRVFRADSRDDADL